MAAAAVASGEDDGSSGWRDAAFGGSAALALGRGSSTAAADATAANGVYGSRSQPPLEETCAVLFNYLIFIAAAAPGPSQT